jgi:hypothetical protein
MDTGHPTASATRRAWQGRICLLALCGMAATTTHAQPAVAPPAAATCVAAADVTPLHLYGLWRAEFEGLPQGATLLFEKHPEYAESVSGGITRDGVRARIAGDVDDGTLTLEESEDGQRISATWNGRVVDASCGKEIRGSWKNTHNHREYSFVLRKVPGWQ